MTVVLGELHISGLGVIDDALIEPSAGLTVVTGETGAGKTMIVTALGLVCGGRADSGRVRSDAARAVVEARFVPSRPGSAYDGDRAAAGAGRPSRTGGRTSGAGEASGSDAVHDDGVQDDDRRRDYLRAAADAVGGDVDDDGSLVCVRSVSGDGRSRAHIGGRSAPVSALTDLTEPLVAVHGQAEAMVLLRPQSQRDVLDSFAALGDELTEYRALRAQWLQTRAEIDDKLSRARDLAQREQVLRLGLGEIDKADPQPGEDREIAAEVRRLDDADALRTAAAGALATLTGVADEAIGDEASASTLVQHAIRLLGAASDPALRQRLDDLQQTLVVLGDVGDDLGHYLADLDADPARLSTLLERQALLRGLVRRYGEDVDGVIAWASAARDELASLDTSDKAIDELRRKATELADRVGEAARHLTEQRRAAAEKLGAAATSELAHLAMAKAAIRIAVTLRRAPEGAADVLTVAGREVSAGPDGADHVEILLTAHPGAPELPVSKGASGGELSRIMLALEVVLAGADPVGTLVFDEVDAGVGGRAATEIGLRLAALARDHQVIVVTHLAQVAAFADKHYVVDAGADGRIGSSAVRAVETADRTTELARMLGGTDGAAALAHAADLLAAAADAKGRSDPRRAAAQRQTPGVAKPRRGTKAQPAAPRAGSGSTRGAPRGKSGAGA